MNWSSPRYFLIFNFECSLQFPSGWLGLLQKNQGKHSVVRLCGEMEMEGKWELGVREFEVVPSPRPPPFPYFTANFLYFLLMVSSSSSSLFPYGPFLSCFPPAPTKVFLMFRDVHAWELWGRILFSQTYSAHHINWHVSINGDRDNVFVLSILVSSFTSNTSGVYSLKETKRAERVL